MATNVNVNEREKEKLLFLSFFLYVLRRKSKK